MASAVTIETPRQRRALAIGLVMAVSLEATEAMAVAAAMPALSEDLGGDSLRLAEVNRKAQLAFGKEIPMVDMLALATIRSLTKYLAGEQDQREAVSKGRDRARTRRMLHVRRDRGRDRKKV